MVNFALLRKAVGYADDTSNSNALMAGLNSDSEVLVRLSKELGVVLNPSKTQCIIFGSVSDSADPMTVDGVSISPSEKISILGFTKECYNLWNDWLKSCVSISRALFQIL